VAEYLLAGGVPPFEIAFVWVAAVMAAIFAARCFEKKMHL